MEKRLASAPLKGALLVLALALGGWGLRWGLPSAERVARVLPPSATTGAARARLAESWGRLHAGLGENLMLNPESFGALKGVVAVPAGWTEVPEPLLNSARAFHLRSGHEDEQSILLALSRMKPRSLDFRSHLFTYGAPHIYAVGASIVFGAATGLVTLRRGVETYLADPGAMAGLYLAGRLVTLAAYAGGALMLLGLGRRAGAAAGALAAALYLMTPAAVVQAHVLKNHTFWTLFALWTLERGARVLERGTPRDYAWAGAAAGLTTASFLGAWPACLIVGAAGAMRLLGLHEPKGRPCPPLPELRGLVLAGACAGAAFLIVNPYWLLDWREALAEMKVLSGFGSTSLGQAWLFMTHALRRGVTDPVLVLMLGGAALSLARGKREPFLLLCAVAFLLALLSTATIAGVTSTRQVRYFTGWVAVGCLLAGRLLAELCALKGAAGLWGRAATAAVLLGLLGRGASYAYNFSSAAGPRSTHLAAGEWIEKNVPAGEAVGLLRAPQPSNSPYFRWDRYRLILIHRDLAPSLPAEDSPKWLVLTIPDYDDRPALGPTLSRYERAAAFPRAKLLPWVELDPTSTTANPLIEIYRLTETAR